tara:strand:- start:1457 stop:1591 length:135 start_codon:yes stop_codon:yes gene_type:complete
MTSIATNQIPALQRNASNPMSLVNTSNSSFIKRIEDAMNATFKI